MNPTMTLKAIRDQQPCAGGWKELLASLGYANGDFDRARMVSLGDIARSNDAADAMWCIRALDWSDIRVRRAVIAGAVMPAVKRAAKHTKNKDVFEAIEIIERWCAGDEKADLNKARKLAAAYADAAAAYAAAAAAGAGSAGTGASGAADAAAAAAAYAAAAARKAEREQQRLDIIAAFPPVALV